MKGQWSLSILFCVYYDFLPCEFINLNFQQTAHDIPEKIMVTSGGQPDASPSTPALTPAKPPIVTNDNPSLSVRETLVKEEALSFNLVQRFPNRGDSPLLPSGNRCLQTFLVDPKREETVVLSEPRGSNARKLLRGLQCTGQNPATKRQQCQGGEMLT